MKTMFASLLAFLQCVYIKNTISMNIDTKKFSIFPSLGGYQPANLRLGTADGQPMVDEQECLRAGGR